MIQDFSFWEYDALDTVWDICIVGSGINGISTGISILEKNPQTKILVIDRWFIPLGASTRNAGFSCFGSPTEILEDVSSLSEQEAIALIRRRWNGLQILRHRLQHSNAQYEIHGGYELYHEHEYLVVLQHLPYLNSLMEEAIGKENVFNQIEVPDGIAGFYGAINNAYEGQLHPYHMMHRLKEIYVKLGGKIWTGLSIEQIVERDDVVELLNSVSIPVKAKKVVVTTNAFTQPLLPQLDVHGARNHVLVTEPVTDLKWKGCFHFDRGYYYFRNIGNRILLGGARNMDMENENTSEFGSNPVIVKFLQEFLYNHLAMKGVTSIEFQWSGIIAVGGSKLPIVQKISPRVFAGVRCSGMGIAMASVTGEQLADLVLQQ